ncbi:hypothetical protein [Mesorhizobium temperatum]|uniref:Uncharacterized protein n=1 Tax=Mesorhizobium temperatum TaxID=241416 RepID=A0A271LT72_9HYPH|nr:hypothetical protein [Mesorhizobium temperatum]PAQ10520.1 hypothetical protein CIT26_07955 [Mesorhizobium temperatum]
MADAKEKMTFGDLEPLICDADNMLDVLLNLMDSTGFTSTDQKISARDHELILFAANVAVDMSTKLRNAYYEVVGSTSS